MFRRLVREKTFYIFYAAIGVLVAALFGDWNGIVFFLAFSTVQLVSGIAVDIFDDLRGEDESS